MDRFIAENLGDVGVILVIGLMVFFAVFHHSKSIFEWIEDKTYENRDYILKQLNLLFISFDGDKLTLILLGISFGLSVVIFAIFALLGFLPLGIVLSILTFIAGRKIPRPFINFLVNRKNKIYQGQMVDALQLLANGLRAGQSLPQSIAMVVDELPAPVSKEFAQVLAQNKIGLSLEESLQELVKRVPIADNEMFVTSVTILNETGGNLPETFNTIVDIIRERVRLQQKIDTYIAQSMTQGTIIFCMPFLMGIMFGMSDPKGMSKLFTTPIGLLFLVVALGLNLFGGFLILKIARIKV